MKIRTFVGDRGSGKTYRLFKEAEVLIDNGFIPVFLCASDKECGQKEEYAFRCIGSKAELINFMTLVDFKGTRLERDDSVRVFIDEIGHFVSSLVFGVDNKGFTATADVEDEYILCDRKDWDNKTTSEE